jgi:hypothetical protein
MAMRRLPSLVIAASGLLLAVAVPAAVAGWGVPQRISARGEPVDFPSVAMNSEGRAIAVWYRTRSDHDLVLRSATRAVGHGFERARTVGRASFTPPAQPPSVPDVAIDHRGNAIAVWLQKRDRVLRVASAFRPRGGSFRRTQLLSARGAPAADPRIAFDRRGNALAVWSRFDGSTTRIQAAFRPRGAGFRRAKTISAAGHRADDPQVAFDRHGNATAVWVQIEGLFAVTTAARRPAWGDFGAPQQLSPGGNVNAQDPQISVAPGGSAIAVWNQADGGGPLVVATAFARPGQGFGTSKVISAANKDSYTPRVQTDARGRATAVWIERPPNGAAGTQRVQAARSGPGGAFGASEVVGSSSVKDLDQPQISVTRGGAAVAAWIAATKAGDTGPSPLRSAVRQPARERFGRPRRVSAAGRSAGFPALADNGHRRAVAVWLGGAGAIPHTVFEAPFRFR